ncbi:MAG: alpha-D-ribose 1-methylphosphonate 5-triphosphate diphosphatase [Beijerinckiaceae bacterium]|nr:alpha-D-ribose 1-methylphosphonate 5-triphosphate diphosphatase [Beijerinckiaceae bacterium]
MSDHPTETILGNAEIILADRVIERGWIVMSDGLIAEVGEGDAPRGALDMAGDTLIPGLVELHTDHLEAHFSPRPKVQWHPLSSVIAYDAQIAASGITTVFDSLRVGQDSRKDAFNDNLESLADTIHEAQQSKLLRVEHLTHLRCEVCSPDVVDKATRFLAQRAVHLMSLMDHTPGIRQFRDIEKWLDYYRGKTTMTEAQLQKFVEERQALNRELEPLHHRKLVELARSRNVPIASHDDTTIANVEESISDGATLAEFPTTIEAAAASHAAGIKVMMGAPNVVRGGSHSGNVAASDLAREGTLDVLSSDYVPGSLLMAAFQLPADIPSITLPQAVRMITKNAAEAAKLHDRGELRAGLRADVVRVHRHDSIPVVRTVWHQGARVV